MNVAKSKTPTVKIRQPVSAAQVAALEAQWEAAGNRTPGTHAASSQARKLAVVQAHEPTPRAAPRERGAWTKTAPYVRKDGTATRASTVYLPVPLAEALRRYAFEHNRKQSDVIAEALAALLER